MAEQERFKKPGWFTRHVFNPAVAGLTRLGISLVGSRVLEVTGRKSGEPRRTPVNLLKFDGAEYLVAPRGETQWVKNVRVNPRARLLVGRRDKDVTLSEMPPAETVPLLRAYLKKWKWEVGQFFGGVGPDSSDEELARIAPDHPVFRVESAA
ncbi:MAG: nitroreductase family deazaflavin-dependent oxidoreductase [Solirubrobacterales bacterium]|jgi:deazaflavin-dependent oxidoreductase (nitroreductase family)